MPHDGPGTKDNGTNADKYTAVDGQRTQQFTQQITYEMVNLPLRKLTHLFPYTTTATAIFYKRRVNFWNFCVFVDRSLVYLLESPRPAHCLICIYWTECVFSFLLRRMTCALNCPCVSFFLPPREFCAYRCHKIPHNNQCVLPTLFHSNTNDDNNQGSGGLYAFAYLFG